MPKAIKVVIAGINGRFGRASARMVMEDPAFQLVGAFGKARASYVGQDVCHMANISAPAGILVSNSIEELPAGIQADVLLDFTVADAAVNNAKYALKHGIRPVIGTSGLGDEQIRSLTEISKTEGTAGMVVPNFSIGAVLMMEFSKQAASYFDHVEIVEMHHTRKLDSPSGTAMHTVKGMEQKDKTFNASEVHEHELLAHARGGLSKSGIRVHSIRLPGLISHQEVIFGAAGELLTVRHDGLTTDSYLRGIKMSLEAVMKLDSLVVGLDKILDMSGKSQDNKCMETTRH